MRPAISIALMVDKATPVMLTHYDMRRKARDHGMLPAVVDAALKACGQDANFRMMPKASRGWEPRLPAPLGIHRFVQISTKRCNVRKEARSFPEWKKVVEAWYGEHELPTEVSASPTGARKDDQGIEDWFSMNVADEANLTADDVMEDNHDDLTGNDDPELSAWLGDVLPSAPVQPSHEQQMRAEGYLVLRDAMQVDDLLAPMLCLDVYGKHGLPLSHDRRDGRDSNRLMSNINRTWSKTVASRLEALCREHAPSIITSADGREKIVAKVVSLYSRPNPDYDETSDDWQHGDQHSHVDENPSNVIGLDDRDMPLSVIVAVQPRTRFRLISLKGVVVNLLLDAGDVLFFRGDVEHYGLGYSRLNVRVHCHLYTQSYKPGQASIHAPVRAHSS